MAAEWENRCGQLQSVIDAEHEISAQKRAIRDAKATSLALPGQSVSMQSIGGVKEAPKLNSAGVPYMKTAPKSAAA